MNSLGKLILSSIIVFQPGQARASCTRGLIGLFSKSNPTPVFLKGTRFGNLRWSKLGDTIRTAETPSRWGRATIVWTGQYVAVNIRSLPGDLRLYRESIIDLLAVSPDLRLITSNGRPVHADEFDSMNFPDYQISIMKGRTEPKEFEAIVRSFLTTLL